MPEIKRLRMFAGPNGSGKTTLFDTFSRLYSSGPFVNADIFEKMLRESGLIDLNKFGLKSNASQLDYFLSEEASKSLLLKAKNEGYTVDLTINEDFIVNKTKNTNSYEAALAASFVRSLLVKAKKSFSFETVLSHPGKIKELQLAKEQGYRTYLYFVCVDDVSINVSRVEKRIEKGGHPVEPKRVEKRYTDTLKNLYAAVKTCDRGAYLFDNSGGALVLVAQVVSGNMILLVDNPPNWFKKYLLPHYL